MSGFKYGLLILTVIYCGACQNEKAVKPKPAPAAAEKSTPAAKPQVENAVAEINGTPITEDEFSEYVRPYPDRMKQSVQGREYVLQAMIDQILMEEEAKRRGLDRDPEFVAKVDAYRRNLLNNLLLDSIKQEGFEVSEKEARKYFEEHPEEFDRPERVNIRHILVATEEEARDIRARLKKGADFETLARQHSRDNFSKDRGGELGPFSRKQRPDLAEAAFRLRKPGALAGPVKTGRGFHVIQLISRIPAQKDRFEDIKDSLQNRLRARRRQEAKKELLATVREKSRIEINQKALETLEVR